MKCVWNAAEKLERKYSKIFNHKELCAAFKQEMFLLINCAVLFWFINLNRTNVINKQKASLGRRVWVWKILEKKIYDGKFLQNHRKFIWPRLRGSCTTFLIKSLSWKFYSRSFLLEDITLANSFLCDANWCPKFIEKKYSLQLITIFFCKFYLFSWEITCFSDFHVINVQPLVEQFFLNFSSSSFIIYIR